MNEGRNALMNSRVALLYSSTTDAASSEANLPTCSSLQQAGDDASDHDEHREANLRSVGTRKRRRPAERSRPSRVSC